MGKYKVTFEIDIEVEANSFEEVEEKADNEWANGNFTLRPYIRKIEEKEKPFDFHWTYLDWDGIRNYERQLNTGMDSVGQCRIGDLCFDLTLRYRSLTRYGEDIYYLDCELYVGGEDTGYGYGENNYPYDYHDGFAWDVDIITKLDVDGFKAFAEAYMTKYIVTCGYIDKAKQSLHIW